MTRGDNHSHQIICKCTINVTCLISLTPSLLPSCPQILLTESINKVDG